MHKFKVEPITKRIFRISMPYVCCYLVLGNIYAVLIDTGWGYGDLLSLVRSITSLPIKVLLTHGHTDHIGGMSQFDEVYMHPLDLEISEYNSTIQARKMNLEYVQAKGADELNKWQPAYSQKILSMQPEFNLGNLTILSDHVPGHTMGSMVYYIVEEKIAIYSDGLSHPTLMTLPESASVEEYYEALLRLKEKNYEIDRALVNHESYEIDPIVLDNNIDIAYKILNREDKKILKKIAGTQGLAAREKEKWLPKDKKLIGNILYREDNIFSKEENKKSFNLD